MSPPNVTPRVLAKFTSAVASRNWVPGVRATYFEAAIARRIDVPPEWVIATSSATTALQAVGVLMTLGDLHLRVCPLTWAGTYCWYPYQENIHWVDCDDQGWPREEVDISVDLWGRPGTSGLIIDAAHNFGDLRHGTFLKKGGQAVVYSFGPTKEVSCFMGGAIVTPNDQEEIRRWLHYGARGRIPAGDGVNGGMPDPVAGWLLEQVKRHDGLKARRQEVLSRYCDHLGDAVLTRPGEASGHICVIDCATPEIRRMYQRALDRSPKIGNSVHYPLAPEMEGKTPGAWALSKRILTLPCHVEMLANDVRRVCARLLQA